MTKKSMKQSQDRMLSVKEVAYALSVSVSHIWKMTRLGKFPKPVKVGRFTRWRLSQVKKWLDSLTPKAKKFS